MTDGENGKEENLDNGEADMNRDKGMETGRKSAEKRQIQQAEPGLYAGAGAQAEDVQTGENACTGEDMHAEKAVHAEKDVHTTGTAHAGENRNTARDTGAGQHNPSTGHNPVHAPIPGLGLRSMKTALAAMFTAILYAFLPESNPTFACIGAIFGMGADMEESRRSGGNRFFGTIIGGFIGLALYWLEHQIYPEGCYWLRLPLVFLGIVIMISLCVLFRWPGGVQPGGVVLCIILFNTPAYHIDYAIHRMIDTGVGVVIALLVNYLLPRRRLEHWFRLDRERRQ